MKRKITVMLVEDNPAYRKVVARTLGSDPDIELTSQFGTAEIALRSQQDMSTRNVPDIILLDLNLPGLSGLEALPHFRQSLPDSKVIVLTQSDREADILSAISNGASGYLLKSATLDQLSDGIQTVVNGGATLDPNVASYILSTVKNLSPDEATQNNKLSERETEILILLSEGLQKKEIGRELGISTKTVASHVAHIYEKLEVPNASAAIHTAYQKGILPT